MMIGGSSDRSVAVLGMGRMGSAMARRLAASGWRVTTWSRSGLTLDGLESAATVDVAFAASSLVILSLFDGPACAQVLDAATGLGAGAMVINTSTVSSDEATALCERVSRTGATYVHAPVLGSVGAVRAGQLTFLAGTLSQEDSAAAEPVLDALGTVLSVGSPADAATLKLVANGALAAVLLAIGDGLAQAQAAGIDRDRIISVLEQSAVGGMTSAKRQRLATGDVAHADFTMTALAKDLTLLAAEPGAGAQALRSVIAGLDSGRLQPDDDIAVLALPRNPSDVDDHQDVRLTVAPGVDVTREVLDPLVAYAAGHATGDPAHFRRAFLPSAHVEGMRDDAFVSWSLDTYCELFTGQSAEDEQSRCRRIEHVTVDGTVATARMTLWHGPATFTDIFLLARTRDGWKITNKVYHRH